MDRMKAVCVPLLLLSLAAAVCQGQTINFCSPNPNPNTAKAMPTYVNISFIAKFEVNIPRKAISVSAVQLYDMANHRGKFSLTVNNQTTTMEVKRQDNLALIMFGRSECEAMPLNETTFLHYYLLDIGRDRVRIITLSSILFRVIGVTMDYKGPVTLERGIPAEQWDYCMSWPDENMQARVSFYHAASSWQTATNGTALLRVELDIQYIDQTSPTPQSFSYAYDLFDFIPNAPLTEMDFQNPRGRYCNGLTSTVPIPQPPAHFSGNIEIVQDAYKIVKNTRVFYDFGAKLFRAEYLPSDPKTAEFGFNPIMEIHDYGTGIRYVMDRVYGNCTVRPIDPNGADGLPDGSGDFSRIRNPYELFLIDDSYVFAGLDQPRGIVSQLWQSLRNATDTLPPILLEWSFMDPRWGDVIGGLVQSNVPIRLAVPRIGSYYNLANLNEETPGIDRFDVSPCYNFSSQRGFRFAFNVPYDQIVTSTLMRNVFLYDAVAALSLYTFSSPLRIVHTRVTGVKDKTFLFFILLEKPPIKGSVQGDDKELALDDGILLMFEFMNNNALNFTVPSIDTKTGELSRTLISPDDLIEIDPNGIARPLNFGQQVAPPVFPSKFRGVTEYTDKISRSTYYIFQWYDYDLKMYAVNYPDTNRGHRVTELHDYDVGVDYVLNSYFGNCTVTTISPNSYEIKMNGTHVAIKNPAELFALPNATFRYVGLGSFRGIDTDIWQSVQTNYPPGVKGNTLWTFYWSAKTWTDNAGGLAQKQVPVAVTIEGIGFPLSMVIQMLDYVEESADLLRFDVQSCFDAKSKRRFSFLLPGEVGDKIDANPHRFEYTVLTAVKTAAGVSPLRVAHIEYTRKPQEITVHFALLGNAPIDQNEVPELTLDEAVKRLRDAIEAGTLVIAIQPDEEDPGAMPTKVTAYGLVERTEGYSVGSIVGLAIGMLITGAIIMIIIGMVMIKRKVKGGDMFKPIGKIVSRTGIVNPNFAE